MGDGAREDARMGLYLVLKVPRVRNDPRVDINKKAPGRTGGGEAYRAEDHIRGEK